MPINTLMLYLTQVIGLDGRGAREEKIGQGVPGGVDPQLIQCALVPKGLDEIKGLPPFRFDGIQPGERGVRIPNL